MDTLTIFLDSTEYERCGHNFSATLMRKIQELVERIISIAHPVFWEELIAVAGQMDWRKSN